MLGMIFLSKLMKERLKKMTCEFWTESQSAHQFISHHISDLRSALGSVGFTDVTISASIDRKKIDEYHSFRNTDEGPNRVLDMKI